MTPDEQSVARLEKFREWAREQIVAADEAARHAGNLNPVPQAAIERLRRQAASVRFALRQADNCLRQQGVDATHATEGRAPNSLRTVGAGNAQPAHSKPTSPPPFETEPE